jgi:tRNA dimethylallyltransferase
VSAGSPLFAVVGPTGSGKSDLALELALAFEGEIVNCDSVQLYRFMNIGTAKMLPAARRGIPHHLLDILDPDEIFTAGDYIRLTRPLLKEIAARNRIPVVTGGTGFYFRSLMEGLFEGPSRDDELRARLMRRDSARLHKLLRRLDPAAASRIHANDTQKVIRAIEVCVLSRRPISAVHRAEHRAPLTGFQPLIIGLDPPRDLLASRIEQRCVRMFEMGLTGEVRGILEKGFSRASKALESIGYREAILHIGGAISYAEAIAQTQIATRQYAKRQRTWFRREAGVQWLRGFGNQRETIEKAKRLAEVFLKNIQQNSKN